MEGLGGGGGRREGGGGRSLRVAAGLRTTAIEKYMNRRPTEAMAVLLD